MKSLVSIVLAVMITTSPAFASKTNRFKKIDKNMSRYAKQVVKKLLRKKNLRLVKDESTALKYNKEEFTYSKKLTFKTKRGFYCQGEMSFEVDLDLRVEKDSVFTNLNCYNINPKRRIKKRRRRS